MAGRKTYYNFKKTQMTSKRSLNGIDNSYENISKLVTRIMQQMFLDPYKRPLSKENVIDISRQIGVIVSPYQATEALFFACKCS